MEQCTQAKSPGGGEVYLLAAIGIYVYLTHIEAADVTTRIPWLLAILYTVGGKLFVTVFLGLVGAATSACGIVDLAKGKHG
ncbi:MAG TPA: hypothetical protein VD886_04265 [Herpetosiphonaceae bacterium]|nr:hypothetical protein [Herpetosiphonaceae bacterium]